jgi:hypothetical protein
LIDPLGAALVKKEDGAKSVVLDILKKNQARQIIITILARTTKRAVEVAAEH